MLPFHAVHAAPELCIALHAALGGTFSAADSAAVDRAGGVGGDGGVVQLVLLHAKGAVLLLRTPPPDGPVDAAAVAVADAGALRLPRWVSRWEAREFAFSSSLDPLVAAAAIHLAVLAHP
eukprot:2105166-Prymnesium_polylepis.2